VKLPRSAGRSGTLRDRPASWTSLWVVQETLATEKGLLAAGEDEFLRAIATGQRSILVHPLPNLLFVRYGGLASRPPSELPRPMSHTGGQCARSVL
jgi:hypothetical protein